MWQEVPLRNLKDFVLTISAIPLGTSRLEAEQISCEISTGMSFDFFGRSMQMMLFVKDASGLSKSTNELDVILLSCHCYLNLSLIILSTHFPEGVFQSFNCTASATFFQFQREITVYRSLCFFSSESQPAGPITRTKRANVKLRKVRQRQYQRYGRYMKELVRNGGIIMDFIRVRKSIFNHQSWKYHQI